LNHILHLTTLIVPSGNGSFPCPIHLSYVCYTIPMVEVRCLWNSSSLLLKFVLTIMLLVTFMLKVFTSLHHVCVFVLLTHRSFQTSKLLIVNLIVFVYSSFEFCYCSFSCVVLLKIQNVLLTNLLYYYYCLVVLGLNNVVDEVSLFCCCSSWTFYLLSTIVLFTKKNSLSCFGLDCILLCTCLNCDVVFVYIPFSPHPHPLNSKAFK